MATSCTKRLLAKNMLLLLLLLCEPRAANTDKNWKNNNNLSHHWKQAHREREREARTWTWLPFHSASSLVQRTSPLMLHCSSYSIISATETTTEEIENIAKQKPMLLLPTTTTNCDCKSPTSSSAASKLQCPFSPISFTSEFLFFLFYLSLLFLLSLFVSHSWKKQSNIFDSRYKFSEIRRLSKNFVQLTEATKWKFIRLFSFSFSHTNRHTASKLSTWVQLASFVNGIKWEYFFRFHSIAVHLVRSSLLLAKFPSVALLVLFLSFSLLSIQTKIALLSFGTNKDKTRLSVLFFSLCVCFNLFRAAVVGVFVVNRRRMMMLSLDAQSAVSCSPSMHDTHTQRTRTQLAYALKSTTINRWNLLLLLLLPLEVKLAQIIMSNKKKNIDFSIRSSFFFFLLRQQFKEWTNFEK